MNEVAFVKKREGDWQRLTQLCDRADLTLKNLQPAEFHELIRLYRRVSADLSTVRTRSNNIQLISFLNDVVARAYGILYRAPRRSVLRSILEALALAAQTMRRCRWFVLSSALLFIGSALFTSVVMDAAPQTKVVFIPRGTDELFDHWKSGKFEERGPEDAMVMTGFYMSNNPRVAVQMAGIAASTFGIGTTAIIYQNGVLLGALAHEMASVGKLPHLFISIAPHGVTELSAMIIAGAAGFVMGWALIYPGRRRRGDALKAAGKDAIVLVTTSWIMMFMAAPIEGFFSFNPRVPDFVKILFALLSAAAWALFWTSFGRTPEENAVAEVA